MANDSGKPVIVFAVAIAVFFVGGFLLVMNVGTNSRTTARMHYDFSLHGASLAASTYFGDFEKGGEVIKKKAATLLDDLVSGVGRTPPASGRTETARQRPGHAGRTASSGEPEGDAFEKYFEKNYGKRSGRGLESAPGSLADLYGGGPAAEGGGGSGSYETPVQTSFRKVPKKGEAAGNEPSGANGSASGPRAVPGGPASGGTAAAPRMYASLPGRGNPLNDGSNSGAQTNTAGGSAGYGNRKLQKDGGLSGFPGKGSAGALDGASESMRTGAQSNYNSKMSGGASAIKSGSSGASAPAASKPGKAAAGGKSDKTSGKTGTDRTTDQSYSNNTPDPVVPGEDPDLVKSVVTEKLNGKDTNYVSENDAAADPEETLLASGAIAGGVDDKAITEPDPEDFSSLAPERKAALKKEMHVFLKQVEKKYGAMQDINYSSCNSNPDVCKAHGLTANYLTMKTAKGATLVMGVKYVTGKWRRYTIDFKAPASGSDQPASNNTIDDTGQNQ
ncbi:MAG: hypothetical protein NTX59_09320 [Elusimicrobia bacterium]|nr:hypothetical protein [Elusimicrobiota bacterium]